MNDPLGLIGNTGGADSPFPARSSRSAQQNDNGPSFKDTLQDQIEQVNEMQRDAKQAVEDLAAGRRDDVEGVILATQKADTAFKMLLQVRNKVMDAYEEIKQVRV